MKIYKDENRFLKDVFYFTQNLLYLSLSNDETSSQNWISSVNFKYCLTSYLPYSFCKFFKFNIKKLLIFSGCSCWASRGWNGDNDQGRISEVRENVAGTR